MNSKKLILILLLMAAFALSASPALADSAPGAVSSVSLTRGDGTVTASWDAPTGATQYHVTYSDDGGASWSLAAYGDASTSVSFGADNASTYVVGVRAGNDHGWSGWTNSPAAGPYTPPTPTPTPTPAPAPDAPSSVSVNRSHEKLTASWDAPSGATKYHVTFSDDGGATWTLAGMDYTSTSITFRVDNPKTYVVGVRAGNDGGWSGWTNSDAADPYTPPTPPDAVSSVSTTRADGTLTASWDAPSGATKYHVTYTSDYGQTWTSAADAHASTSITISAVNAKAYTVGVRAGNGGGWSDWTNSPLAHSFFPPERGIIIQDADGNPITALAVPEGGEAGYYVKLAAAPKRETKVCVYISVRDKNDPDITFKGEAADVVSIDVIFTPDNWDTPQTVTLVAAEDDDSVNGACDSGLDARDYYAGKVDLAVTEIDNDAPDAPSSVTVTRADGTLTASWDAPAGATKYHVTYSDNGMQSWSLAADAHPSTSITISADNAKTYTVGVRAGNDGGWSDWTNSDGAGPLLAAPTNLSVTPGDGYLDIAWNAVTGATGYDVRAKAEGSSDWHSVADNVTGTSHRYTTSQTMDYIAVRATNANGNSAWTERSRGPDDDWLTTVQTVQQDGLVMAAAQAQNQSQLAAPASITVTRDNDLRDENLQVSWAAVSGASGYNLTCSFKQGWTWWQCGSTTSGSTTTHTVSNGPNGVPLAKERSYLVAVRAVTSNPSDASNWTTSANIRPVFGYLRNLTATRGNNSITLSWTPNFWTTGYLIDCAVSGQTRTRCATLTNQDDTAATHSVTISTWTAGGTNYSIDNTKTYDVKIISTNQWGQDEMLAPLVRPVLLDVSNVTTSSATLSINYTGAWWYKRTVPSDTACNSVSAGTQTVNLSSLTGRGLLVHGVQRLHLHDHHRALGHLHHDRLRQQPGPGFRHRRLRRLHRPKGCKQLHHRKQRRRLHAARRDHPDPLHHGQSQRPDRGDSRGVEQQPGDDRDVHAQRRRSQRHGRLHLHLLRYVQPLRQHHLLRGRVGSRQYAPQ